MENATEFSSKSLPSSLSLAAREDTRSSDLVSGKAACGHNLGRGALSKIFILQNLTDFRLPLSFEISHITPLLLPFRLGPIFL